MTKLRLLALVAVTAALVWSQVPTTGMAVEQDAAAVAKDCSKTSVGLTPLTELKADKYQGFKGGLYPKGKNRPPKGYLKSAKKKAAKVRPRGPDGNPSAGGEIGLLSIGVSNTAQEFRRFENLAAADNDMANSIVTANGARGGQDAETIRDPSANYWDQVDREVEANGLTADQVQVVWLKQAMKGPDENFPNDAEHLQAALKDISGILTDKFDNLRLIFVTSRIYGGYADTGTNPEPFAYQGGFAVKWLIGDRIRNRPKARPWVGWGPYLWADGLDARKDGLTWTCQNFESDGTHPSPSGEDKVASRLLTFFKRNGIAKSWFVKP
jgi:hypothetical protein